MSSATAADSPTRQLARVKNGQAVGVITLPCRHRILADGRRTPDKKLLVCRINSSGAYCWHREQYASVLEKHLSVAEGAIETASSPEKCDGWPSRYTTLGGDSR